MYFLIEDWAPQCIVNYVCVITFQLGPQFDKLFQCLTVIFSAIRVHKPDSMCSSAYYEKNNVVIVIYFEGL